MKVSARRYAECIVCCQKTVQTIVEVFPMRSDTGVVHTEYICSHCGVKQL